MFPKPACLIGKAPSFWIIAENPSDHLKLLKSRWNEQAKGSYVLWATGCYSWLRQTCLHHCRATALLSFTEMLLTHSLLSPHSGLRIGISPLESSFTPLSLFVMSVWPDHPSAPGTDEGMIWINSVPWREVKLLKFKLEHSDPPNGFAMVLWCWKCILENSYQKAVT